MNRAGLLRVGGSRPRNTFRNLVPEIFRQLVQEIDDLTTHDLKAGHIFSLIEEKRDCNACHNQLCQIETMLHTNPKRHTKLR
jgi:hypothetical protein